MRKLLLVLLFIFAVFIFINANAAVKSDGVDIGSTKKAAILP